MWVAFVTVCVNYYYTPNFKMGLGNSKKPEVERSMSLNSMRKHNLELTLVQLNELMKTRGKETVAKIEQDYGCVEDLCNKLGVAPNEGT